MKRVSVALLRSCSQLWGHVEIVLFLIPVASICLTIVLVEEDDSDDHYCMIRLLLVLVVGKVFLVLLLNSKRWTTIEMFETPRKPTMEHPVLNLISHFFTELLNGLERLIFILDETAIVDFLQCLGWQLHASGLGEFLTQLDEFMIALIWLEGTTEQDFSHPFDNVIQPWFVRAWIGGWVFEQDLWRWIWGCPESGTAPNGGRFMICDTCCNPVSSRWYIVADATLLDVGRETSVEPIAVYIVKRL